MTTISGITDADIAEYLANNPAFFERHAELLASVTLKSPHGGRAVSLQERQAEMLRERAKGLEAKIVEMIRHGQENVAIAERLHRWTRALMLERDAAKLPELLLAEAMHRFLVPQAALRVWNVAPAYASLPAAQEVSVDARSFAQSLTLPYCGLNSGFEAARWLEDPAAAMSMALLPLRAGDGVYGLLVLASPDPTRYTAEMGTEFLLRIADVAGAALTRLLPADTR